MEGEIQPPAVASAAVSKVLDDDDLLIEILLCVTFPTTLVCASLVCKHWLRRVSDPKFLHQFCKLHPPPLLGFYIVEGRVLNTPHFVPMLPQPPELARRVNFSLDKDTYVMDCRNGNILTVRCKGSGLALRVHNVLCPDRGMTIETPHQMYQPQDDNDYYFSSILSREERDMVSYVHVAVWYNTERTKSNVQVYILHGGDGIWRKHLTLATDQLLCVRWEPRPVLVDNKIYMVSSLSEREIVVLNLVASSLSTIQLPQEVDYGILGTVMLSRDDDSSGVYLVHAKDLHLRIWLHKGGCWLLVDNISLRDMCADLRMSDFTVEAEHTAPIWISQVGDNAEFVFLQIDRFILYLDIKRKTMHKVYEMTKKDRCPSYHIQPCKMSWPPTFPPLKDDPARNGM